MLIPLGILATGITPPTFEHIETVSLAATATSVTFSSILQDYSSLQIRYIAKTSTTRNTLWVNMNGATTALYSANQLNGNSTVVAATNTTAQTKIIIPNGIAAGTTNIFAAGVMDIFDYSNTLKNTTIRSSAGVNSADAGNQERITQTGGGYHVASAITSLTFAPDADSFAIGTRFSLYGIRG